MIESNNGNRMKKIYLLIAFLLACVAITNAKTWKLEERECPLCKTKGKYPKINNIVDYNADNWKSKFQLISFPYADKEAIYQCKNCRYSRSMFYFDSIPKEAVEPINKLLDSIRTYSMRSFMQRYDIAERINEILRATAYEKSHFYRVMAYHYYKGGQTEKAKEYRLKSLEIAKAAISDTSQFYCLKENTFIVGSMYYFTGNNDSALVYLKKAKELDINNQNLPNGGKRANNFVYLQTLNETNIENQHAYISSNEQTNWYFNEIIYDLIISIIDGVDLEVKDTQ